MTHVISSQSTLVTWTNHWCDLCVTRQIQHPSATLSSNLLFDVPKCLSSMLALHGPRPGAPGVVGVGTPRFILASQRGAAGPISPWHEDLTTAAFVCFSLCKRSEKKSARSMRSQMQRVKRPATGTEVQEELSFDQLRVLLGVLSHWITLEYFCF